MDVVCVLEGGGHAELCRGSGSSHCSGEEGGEENNGSGWFSLPSLQSPHGRFFSVLFVWSNSSKGS